MRPPGGIGATQLTQAQIDALVSPPLSKLIFNTTTAQYQYWDGLAWQTMGGGGGTPAAPAMIRYVATDGDDTDGNGSLIAPYKTIQKAYDEVADLGPSQNNPGAVFVCPGQYTETVIMDEDHVAIVGTGGQQVTNIGASTGPSIIVTNATRESVAAFLAAGGASDPETHFSELITGSKVPRNVQIRDVSLIPISGGTPYRLMCVGIGDGNSVGGSEINLMRVCNWGKTWARCVNYMSVQGACWFANLFEAHNIAGLWANDSQLTGYSGYYNTADDEPSDSGNYGLCGGKTMVVGNLSLSGSARAGAGDPNGGLVLFQITGDLDLDDTSALTMAMSGVGGDLDAEGSASFDLKGCHIQGAVSIGSGGGTALMDGGHYMGALTDPDEKFVRNAGY